MSEEGPVLLLASAHPFTALGLTLCLASIAYLGFALLRVRGFRHHAGGPARHRPPVTVLKPVCGLDAGLYCNLCSFCEQDYPLYQVVFGVRDADDPALAVIERVLGQFPGRDLALVVDDRIVGTNLKVSNLCHMFRVAKYDTIVIADSDMRVDGSYLSAVVAPFEDDRVGAVTCLYKGVPAGGLPSRLGSAFINEWFLPSVLVALAFQKLRFCFGATMAVRRDALERIGGFEALAGYLADDHMLGKQVSELGFEVRLSTYVVDNIVFEPSLRALFLHELRWARTIRSVQPWGYAFSFLTHALPVSLLFVLVTGAAPVALAVFTAALLLRILLHYAVRAGIRIAGPAMPWLAPVRDLLCFAVWAASFFGRSVWWKEQNFSVRSDSHLTTRGARNL